LSDSASGFQPNANSANVLPFWRARSNKASLSCSPNQKQCGECVLPVRRRRVYATFLCSSYLDSVPPAVSVSAGQPRLASPDSHSRSVGQRSRDYVSRSRHIVPVELGHSGLGLRIPGISPPHLEFTVGRRDPGGKEIGCFWGGREGFGQGTTRPGGGVSEARVDCWRLCEEKERECRRPSNAGEEGSASPGCAYGELRGLAERTAVASVAGLRRRNEVLQGVCEIRSKLQSESVNT
jgi:hypothetical protein